MLSVYTYINSSSSPSQLMYGVPQGSVLWPILFVLYTTPLSDIIANHSVNHQLFADDTQFQTSAPLSEVTNLTKELNACTDDVKTWTTENRLKLNEKHIAKICQTAYFELKRISSIRRFLTEDAAKTLVTSYKYPLTA